MKCKCIVVLCCFLALFTCSAWGSQLCEETFYPPVWLQDEGLSLLVPVNKKIKHLHNVSITHLGMQGICGKSMRARRMQQNIIMSRKSNSAKATGKKFQIHQWRTDSVSNFTWVKYSVYWRVRWLEVWAPWGRLPRRRPEWGRRCPGPSLHRTTCGAAMLHQDTSS